MCSKFSNIPVLPYAMALLAAMGVSCSILEDRSACPCVLTLDLSDPVNASCDSLLVDVWSSDGFTYSAYVSRDEFDEPYKVKVLSRRGAVVSVVDAAMSRMYTCGGGGDGGTRIPSGEQCPLAYMYSASVETSGEECAEKVSVRKNYCGVSMSFVSSDLGQYEVKVLGNVCGYSAQGSPLEGEFIFYPMADSPDACYFRLPRQIDSSLKLSLKVPGGREKIFALGNYIVESGYDWSRADLDDLAITIDYASTSISITIDGWSTCIEYELVV